MAREALATFRLGRIQILDGGFAMLDSNSFIDFLLVKTDSSGELEINVQGEN